MRKRGCKFPARPTDFADAPGSGFTPRSLVLEEDANPPATLAMYGADPTKTNFASNCLLARRLVERGVRFVQVFLGGWDAHQLIYDSMPKLCRKMDQPAATLIRDLKQRGMFDDALVVWAGEIGRTPMVQDVSQDGMTNAKGRNHHTDTFPVLVAGGGCKTRLTHGETDDLGCRVVRDADHVHDLQATPSISST